MSSVLFAVGCFSRAAGECFNNYLCLNIDLEKPPNTKYRMLMMKMMRIVMMEMLVMVMTSVCFHRGRGHLRLFQ